jgi:hypothetical protein
VPEAEEDSDYGDGFKGLLIEASETFRHNGPDFAMNDNGVKARTV